jgi:LCP family protein required for cell wall assembly
LRGLKWRGVLGHAGYVFACVLSVVVLVVAGFASEIFHLVRSVNTGADTGTSSSVGEMNILVMGLESRTNFEGQDLSVKQLMQTHSGNAQSVAAGQVGAQDTDTLILIHIFAAGKKAVGFSIPRDDLVNYPHATLDGLTEGKIDAAYDYAYNQYIGQHYGKESSSALYLGANQAGQLFEVQTVESVTGVHIDHFAESNIIGFYYLAQQFGGLEVCIKPAPAQGGFAAGANLTDHDAQTGTDNSGFDAYQDGYNRKKGGPQYLHLSAAQSLAYVRSRDTLPGVDIGRTARQQAAIDYVIWKLKHGNVLSDFNTVISMLSAAKNFLITDSNWDLPSFATDMGALTGKNLSFSTLAAAPTNNVQVPGYPSPQSVNYIDVPAIQRAVSKAFYASPTPSVPSSTVDVYNGGGASGLAGDASRALVALGYKAGVVANASSQSQTLTAGTQVFYGTGAEANAASIANYFGTTTAAPLSSLKPGHVEILLGSSVTALPPGLETYGASTVTAQDYISAAHADGIRTAAATASTWSFKSMLLTMRALTAAVADPRKPSSTTVTQNAPYGIPCVY